MKNRMVQEDLRKEPASVLWSVTVKMLGSDLTTALTPGISSLYGGSTPVCGVNENDHHSHHLRLGQACLNVKNKDQSAILELWAQAVECYQCPPWLYLSMDSGTSQTLAVNTTYPTTLYIRDDSHKDLYQIEYHFGEYGEYFLGLNSANASSIYTEKHPENEYIALIVALVFYFMLAFIWQCTKLLRRRMASSTYPPILQESHEDGHIPSASPSSSHQDSHHISSSMPSTSSDINHELSSSFPADSNTSSRVQSPVLGHQQGPIPDTRREGGRLRSLDAFRGLAIVLMIFVNYGGGKYYFFAHARWNGLTVADLVFPWFIWIMGTSMVFSVRSQLQRATRRHLIVLRVIKRCIILFALGIIINSTNGHNNMPTFRILGVLQRFAISYFLAAIIEIYCTNPQESPEYVWYWVVRDVVRSCPQWVFTFALVALHTCITFTLPVAGCPTGYLGPGGLHAGGKYSNCTGGAAGYIDRMVLGRDHVYSHPSSAVIYNSDTPYDPEGLLGALTSVLMVQMGAACGRIILTFPTHKSRIIRWLVWAVTTGLVAGFLCNWRKEGGTIPVNKNLWSLSFIFCTTSFAFTLFSIFYYVIDKKKWWSGNPFRYAGLNSILLYVGHEISGDLFPWSWKPVGQHHTNYLIMNLWGMSIWIVIAFLLHRKKVYVSV